LQEAYQAAEDAPDCSEPVDESQAECAISGDSFEVFWDETTETHRYRHAKRLYGEEADAYGVPDGSLVNVKSMLTFLQGDVPATIPAAPVKQEPSPAAASPDARPAAGTETAVFAAPNTTEADTQAAHAPPGAAGDDQQAVGQKRPHEAVADGAAQPLEQPGACAVPDRGPNMDPTMLSVQKKLKV
jgi:hypothetical protein